MAITNRQMRQRTSTILYTAERSGSVLVPTKQFNIKVYAILISNLFISHQGCLGLLMVNRKACKPLRQN